MDEGTQVRWSLRVVCGHTDSCSSQINPSSPPKTNQTRREGPQRRGRVATSDQRQRWTAACQHRVPRSPTPLCLPGDGDALLAQRLLLEAQRHLLPLPLLRGDIRCCWRGQLPLRQAANPLGGHPQGHLSSPSYQLKSTDGFLLRSPQTKNLQRRLSRSIGLSAVVYDYL